MKMDSHNQNQLQPQLLRALDKTLENWKLMQGIETEQAEEAADRFQVSFYAFIDELREWFVSNEEKPKKLEDALALPMIQLLTNRLDGPLYLNFETELEIILEGKVRDEEDMEY